MQVGHVRDLGLNPIIMLALVDHKFPSLGTSPMNPPPELIELMKHASRAFGVPANMVSPLCRYSLQSDDGLVDGVRVQLKGKVIEALSVPPPMGSYVSPVGGGCSGLY